MTVRDVVVDALVEPMIVLPCFGAAHATVRDGLRRLGRDAEDDRHGAAERGLDRVFVADAVLQRNDGGGRVELAREGAQRAQRVDRFDEEKQHLRSVQVVRTPRDRNLACAARR